MPVDRAHRLRRLSAARLYFVCEGLPHGRDPSGLLDASLRGGADIVQLREKSPRCAEEIVSLADSFRHAAAQHGALFILNDRPDLVAECGADGVHVGQEDTSVAEARELAGPAALVGLSTHSPEQVEAACAAAGDDRPDQISVGPVWETPTKAGRPATGLQLIEFAAREATVPWFAIGGIDVGNVAEAAAAGASRIVVVRAIRDAEDPEARRARPARSAGRRGRRRSGRAGHGGRMASRERKRTQRQKRKARSSERRAEVAARYEERNQAAREALEPLTPTERPVVVTVGAVISGLVALSVLVAYAAGATVNGDRPHLLQVIIPALLMGAMAIGMWRVRYWAVLGFQAVLALLLLGASLGLLSADGVAPVIGNVVLIAVAGTLFYFMIKAMARIQMPTRERE